MLAWAGAGSERRKKDRVGGFSQRGVKWEVAQPWISEVTAEMGYVHISYYLGVYLVHMSTKINDFLNNSNLERDHLGLVCLERHLLLQAAHSISLSPVVRASTQTAQTRQNPDASLNLPSPLSLQSPPHDPPPRRDHPRFDGDRNWAGVGAARREARRAPRQRALQVGRPAAALPVPRAPRCRPRRQRGYVDSSLP